jgi:hypothetical protein
MSQTQTVVSIEKDRFLINVKLINQGRSWKGKPIEGLLFNSRMANAIINDENPATRGVWAYPDEEFSPERNTREFIASLPDYHAHSLRAVSINLQGGSPQGYRSYAGAGGGKWPIWSVSTSPPAHWRL